jgi:membrane protease YdiL (CAAX protease family)
MPTHATADAATSAAASIYRRAVAEVDPTYAVPALDAGRRSTLKREVVLVFAVSLGRSGVYAFVSFAAALTSSRSLASQTATLNTSYAPGRPTLDLIYQVLAIVFALVPVALAWHFLAIGGERASRILGIDASQPGRDLGRGVVLAALVGGTGLVFYLVAYAAGINLQVAASGLPAVWWRWPVLISRAVMNAVLEESLVAGYLLHRLGQLGVRPWRAVAASALLRGSYHLYQGVGGFVGNAAMGVLFGRLYQRWGRTMPLIIAHALIDIVAFIGYALLAGKVSWLP